MPASVVSLGDRSFNACIGLETINLDNIINIGAYAFGGTSTSPLKVQINELPENLETIGMSAFWNAGPNVYITKIPNKVEIINNSAFYNCENVVITHLGSDDGSSKLRSIDTQAFHSCAKNSIPGNAIYIFKSVTFLGRGIFENGFNSLENIYIRNSQDSYQTSIGENLSTKDENWYLFTSQDTSGNTRKDVNITFNYQGEVN